MLETNIRGKELRNNMREIITLKWEKGNLFLLDQTLLPNTVTYVACKSLEDVYQAIQTMIAVSYTHLDVYKRQTVFRIRGCTGRQDAGQ